MQDYFAAYKMEIDKFLGEYLLKTGKYLTPINNFGPLAAGDLYDFTSRGKMIRGGLVFLADEICGGKTERKALVKTAASLELLQSALIIHDDIMDRDLERRGRPSIFALYCERVRGNTEDYYHLGESLGICAGDISFFCAFKLISKLEVSAETRMKLYGIITREMQVVATAQMQDIVNGSCPSFPAREEILNLYRYKTGRYTFSLPLAAGAVLAGAPDEQIKALEDLGEIMGIIFQIRDDQLGLSGNSKKTGKPVGSDIREGKKTLQMYELRELLPEADKMLLDSALSGCNTDGDSINRVLELFAEYSIMEKMDSIMNEYKKQLEKNISLFPAADPDGTAKLLKLLEFISARDR